MVTRQVLRYIQQEQLLADTDSVLVAVSGGADSVALLHVLVALRERLAIRRLTVLHFDHRLRGAASAADQAFVESLAAALALPFSAGSADVRAYQQQHRISLEMAARICRHRFFRDALSRLGAQAIALGHTANDQAEEILLRLVRGTGPAGMAGMLPKTADHLIRPLLGVTRREILAYLREQQLTYREDISNVDLTHQRNAIRHGILPLFEKHFHARVIEVLCRHTQLARAEESFWADRMADLREAPGIPGTPSRIALDGQHLSQQHPALQRRFLRLAIERLQGNLQGISCRHIEAVRQLLVRRTEGRSIRLPRGLRAMMEGNALILCHQPEEAPATAKEDDRQLIDGAGSFRLPSFTLTLTFQDLPAAAAIPAASDASRIVRLDADRVRWPLFLRCWENGDRFQPLGLGGMKKLQDFFVDSKIHRRTRHLVPLLCDQEKIVWVVGYRLDDRVKITPQTRRLLVIEKTDG